MWLRFVVFAGKTKEQDDQAQKSVVDNRWKSNERPKGKLVGLEDRMSVPSAPRMSQEINWRPV